MPAHIAPQLCTLVKNPPAGADWIHEIKWDGYRLIARVDKKRVQIFTRNGHDWTEKFPNISRELAALPVKSAFLDGELCALDARGASDFSALKSAIGRRRDSELVFYLFDLMYLDGRDLRDSPLIERRQKLQGILGIEAGRKWRHIQFSEAIDGDPAAFFRHACEHRLEGIISKQAHAPYRSRRTSSWLKIKCAPSDEFIIGGYTLSTDRRGIGALLLGHYESGHLVYDGRVGSGITTKLSAALKAQLSKLAIDKPPFDQVKRNHAKGAIWVQPAMVCEVKFTARTGEGLLRQASFKGVREDKDARQVATR